MCDSSWHIRLTILHVYTYNSTTQGTYRMRHSTTYECHDSYIYVCHDSNIGVPWLKYRCAMTCVAQLVSDLRESHRCRNHGAHTNESWRTYEWVTAPCEWVMGYIWMSHVTHIDVAHIWMSHGTRVNESWDTYGWVMSHIWMSHGAHMNESRRTCEWVMGYIWMSHVTHMDESCHTYAQLLSTLPKNALIALFSSEVRQTCSKTPWNVPASTNYDVRLYKVHLSLYIKTFPEHFFEPIYHFDRVD